MIDRVSTYSVWVGMAVLLAMMLLTAVDVFLRFGFRRSIPGVVEIMGNYLMVAAVFLPLAYGMVGGDHITADFVICRLSPRLRIALEAIGLLLSLVIYSLIVWYTASGAFRAWKTGDSMVNIRLPLWPGRALLPIGGFVLCIQLAVGIYRRVDELFKERCK